MLRLPLHDWHSQRARMFEFAGWEMPLVVPY
jgi:glycine cleavage system aminomethyltransferase T